MNTINVTRVQGVFPRKGRKCYKVKDGLGEVWWYPVDQFELANIRESSTRLPAASLSKEAWSEVGAEIRVVSYDRGDSHFWDLPKGAQVKVKAWGNPASAAEWWVRFPGENYGPARFARKG